MGLNLTPSVCTFFWAFSILVGAPVVWTVLPSATVMLQPSPSLFTFFYHEEKSQPSPFSCNCCPHRAPWSASKVRGFGETFANRNKAFDLRHMIILDKQRRHRCTRRSYLSLTHGRSWRLARIYAMTCTVRRPLSSPRDRSAKVWARTSLCFRWTMCSLQTASDYRLSWVFGHPRECSRLVAVPPPPAVIPISAYEDKRSRSAIKAFTQGGS